MSSIKNEMTYPDLKKHPDYTALISDWEFYERAYNGGKPFTESIILKNERETISNWNTRIEEAVCFNYSSAVINIFSYFLTEKTVHREMAGLEQDPQWMLFAKNCNLENNSFEDFLNDQQKMCAVYGMGGVLIDKPATVYKLSPKQEAELNLYPYLVSFSMKDIHDWTYERNINTGVLELVYLKLYIDIDTYAIWTKTEWAIWQTNKKETKKISSGENPIGEIPFVFFFNIKSLFNPQLGVSDIVDVSLIQAAISRNMSAASEIIKYAGFPMLRMPMEPEGINDITETAAVDKDIETAHEVVISSRSVLEFDPQYPNSKPDWLEAAVLEPIRAILDLIDRMTDEMYRTSHLSGIYSQRAQAQTKSGTALKYEFHQLNSVLSKKARNLTDAERQIIRFWLLWQQKKDLFKDIVVKRSDEFSLSELTETLENILISVKLVKSQEFLKAMRRQVVEKLAPNIPQSKMNIIIDEIDAMIENFETDNQIPEAARTSSPKKDLR